MDREIVEGAGMMAVAAGVGAGISLMKTHPVAAGVRQGLTVGTLLAAAVTIFSNKHRDAAAVTTAVGVAALLTESLVQGA